MKFFEVLKTARNCSLIALCILVIGLLWLHDTKHWLYTRCSVLSSAAQTSYNHIQFAAWKLCCCLCCLV